MSSTAQSERVLSYDEAVSLIAQHSHSLELGREGVPLLKSAGRVLAEEIVADRDQPPFPRATRDGYAVRSEETKPGASLHLAGSIRAGEPPPADPASAAANSCFEIMTGAAVPEGFDAVIMVEQTRREGERVVLERGLGHLENVVERGSEAKGGEVLLRAGARMGFAGVALAASVGREQVDMWKKPRVAVLATGDELVAVSASPQTSQIRNSNTYSLAVQLESAGAEAEILPVAPDERERLEELMVAGATSDLLLISGGVSMGRYDLVEEVLRRLGAEFLFTGVRIQPGKPTVFGRLGREHGRRYFFGLPGNPLSTMVTFELFVRPFLRKLGGETETASRFGSARLKGEVRTRTGLTRFLPARLGGTHLAPEVEAVAWQGSGDIVSAARAGCFLIVPPERDSLHDGEMVCVLLP